MRVAFQQLVDKATDVPDVNGFGTIPVEVPKDEL